MAKKYLKIQIQILQAFRFTWQRRNKRSVSVGKIVSYAFFGFFLFLVYFCDVFSLHHSVPSCVSNRYFMRVDEFNNCISNFNVLQFNVCSFKDLSRLNRFLFFISSLSINLDVIVVGEIWIERVTCGLYNIPGYKAYFSCRDGNGSGLCRYIRENFKHRLIEIRVDTEFFLY